MYDREESGKNKNMKFLFLKKNPDLFQGEKYLKSHKNYFEGWYYKNINAETGISFILGIHTDKTKRKAFIQIITMNQSYFVNYAIEDFYFEHVPFKIQIGNNIFTKTGIHLDIMDQNISVTGDIQYSNSQNIKTNWINPNIMGPFSFVLLMECYHAILCMKNKVNGIIYLNNDKFNFHDGIGYIEKDWGYSFPKSYIWCQANHFLKSDASLMVSIADIPFGLMTFRGLICVLMLNQKEYRFTTYNFSKITEYVIDQHSITITLKRKSSVIKLQAEYDQGFELAAPIKGKMEKQIVESISAVVKITLTIEDRVLLSDTSTLCGLEIVS